MNHDARSLLDEILCAALVAGLLLVMLVPGARASVAIGWLPLWLVGMPAVAWWALWGFPLPQRAQAAAAAPARAAAARRVAPQARRSTRARCAAAQRRAA